MMKGKEKRRKKKLARASNDRGIKPAAGRAGYPCWLKRGSSRRELISGEVGGELDKKMRLVERHDRSTQIHNKISAQPPAGSCGILRLAIRVQSNAGCLLFECSYSILNCFFMYLVVLVLVVGRISYL